MDFSHCQRIQVGHRRRIIARRLVEHLFLRECLESILMDFSYCQRIQVSRRRHIIARWLVEQLFRIDF